MQFICKRHDKDNASKLPDMQKRTANFEPSLLIHQTTLLFCLVLKSKKELQLLLNFIKRPPSLILPGKTNQSARRSYCDTDLHQ